MKPIIHLNPPKRCDICNESITNKFYDVKIISMGGVWGNICPICFKQRNCKLGTGLGQEYIQTFKGFELQRDWAVI